MLIRLSVENFRSIKDRVELSLIPGKTQRLENHVFKGTGKNGLDVLKGAIIYGANASGKSNLVKAVLLARNLVKKGTRANQSISVTPFKLNTVSNNSPTRIEFEFRSKGMQLAYGFSITSLHVVEEWLFLIGKGKEEVVFERVFDIDSNKYKTTFGKIKFKNNEEKQFLNFVAKGTRHNQLFLAEVIEREVKENVSGIDSIMNAIYWFDKILTVITPKSRYHGIEAKIQKNQDKSIHYANYLNHFDTGINGIDLVESDFEQFSGQGDRLKQDSIEKIKALKEGENLFINAPDSSRYMICKSDDDDDLKLFKLVTQHRHIDSDQISYFDLNEESDGTQRLMDLIPGFIDAIEGEKVFFIDELDRSLHPVISRTIIDDFFNKNPASKSQLIVTTHEASLLDQDIIRKDEIWFVEKNKDGVSTAYSLEEFKPVRFDTDIQKGYLNGRYGAIPFIRGAQHVADFLNE
ncbi:AAA family ATPase [Hymenobacter nivis]|uniref:ATP-binding protein n=1 Tax=Hymenobacter nivis TaxID=1850093 RepID=A0A502GLW6_9BACT|nr:ATP-binding protein [Hymenobacter nivis]TPG62864.1 ATP-binding protein [Hymenobacter nivis]